MDICEDALKIKFSALEELFTYLGNLTVDEKLKSHFARYMIVTTYAAFESGIKDMFYVHIDRTVQNSQISSYLKKTIKQNYRNLDFGQLLYLVNMFDNCAISLESSYKNSEEANSFDSIVTNRQYIAHGGSCTTTFSEIERYYNKAKPMLLNIASTLDSR